MIKVSNISAGPRGIWSTSGLVTLEAGESRDLELAAGEEPGEWFQFDGVGGAPASAASGDAASAAQVEALAKRAEEAETMLELVQDELATIKRSGPIVAAAVASLDHENNDHWTSSGEPKVDAVKAITGGDVSRADIDAASPGFNRDAAKDSAAA